MDAAGGPLVASPAECHGMCYGVEAQRDGWSAPRIVAACGSQARPGYDSMTADEYEDAPEVLAAKAELLVDLIRRSTCCVVYSGAGLSTSAGIGDYASHAPETRSGAMAGGSFRSPLCAQPTAAHGTLVALHRFGRVHRWVNQNHDGLPQKAGLPQEAINEIHGAWHAPDNPVIPMSGALREDLFADLLDCAARADLVVAVGTSLSGMNADRLVIDAARRAEERGAGQLGAVIVGLQRTVHDAEATLRIFARCDEVFARVAAALEVDVPPPPPAGEFFVPLALEGRSEDQLLFHGLRYDAAGCRADEPCTSLDLREDAQLVITGGLHAGACGEVVGMDREGNIKCRFILRPAVGKLRAPMELILGRWWIQAAVDATVPRLPVVNAPDGTSPAVERLRDLIAKYAA